MTICRRRPCLVANAAEAQVMSAKAEEQCCGDERCQPSASRSCEREKPREKNAEKRGGIGTRQEGIGAAEHDLDVTQRRQLSIAMPII